MIGYALELLFGYDSGFDSSIGQCLSLQLTYNFRVKSC